MTPPCGVPALLGTIRPCSIRTGASSQRSRTLRTASMADLPGRSHRQSLADRFLLATHDRNRTSGRKMGASILTRIKSEARADRQ